MGGRMDFDLGFGVRGSGARAPGRKAGDGAPFRLLLVGDFSGRGPTVHGQTRAPLRRPLAIDAGDVDLALSRLQVSSPIEVPGAAAETAQFQSLEDFHPDALFGRLAAFAEPRRMRAALASPAPSPDTFAAVEAWLQSLIGPGATAAPTSQAAAVPAGESAESALERLLGRAPAVAPSPPVGGGAPAGGAASVVNELLAGIVRSHITADVSARRAPLLSALDEVLTRQMRAVLEAPRLRALEALWRGVDRIARTVDTDSELQIALLDADPTDLAAALPVQGGSLEASALHHLLVADEPRGWSVIAVEAAFERTRADLSLLAALGALAARAGAALLADARPGLAGASALDQLAAGSLARPAPAGDGDADGAFWQALRESPLAQRIALGVPRVLARLPYGKKTEPVSAFPFEELPPRASGKPGYRVWGSAAFALAQGCAAAYRAEGWNLDPGGAFDIDDLPAHTFDDDGESRLVPSTEVAFGERAAAALGPWGLTPLLARADRGAARCPGLSSIASSPAALSGPWSPDTDD